MAPFPYAVAMGGQGGRLRRLWGRVTVAAVIVAPVFVAVGATSAVADNAATGGVSSVVVFDDAASPADALAPVVEDSVAASPRSRFVDIDSEVLLTELADDDVTFELFDDVTVVFGDLGELTVGADGNETWSATAATATGTLSFAADGVRGSIQSGATTYSIVPVDGATHLLFEEGRSFPPTEEPLVPPAEPTWANDAPASARFDRRVHGTAVRRRRRARGPCAHRVRRPVERLLRRRRQRRCRTDRHDRRGQRGVRPFRCQSGDAVRRHRTRRLRLEPGSRCRTDPDHEPR